MEQTKVKLNGKGLGVQEFPIEHAQKLLDYEKSKGFENWTLEDEKFELKNGIITYRNTASTKKAKEQVVVGESSLPSEQA